MSPVLHSSVIAVSEDRGTIVVHGYTPKIVSTPEKYRTIKTDTIVPVQTLH